MNQTATVDQLIPHDLDAERSVLGAILVDQNAFGRVVQVLRRDDFYAPAHQQIYKVMLDLFDRDQPIDILLLKAELDARQRLEQVGGVEYLLSLAEAVPSAASAEYYGNIVKHRSMLRQIIAAGDEMIRTGRSGGGDFRWRSSCGKRSIDSRRCRRPAGASPAYPPAFTNSTTS